MDRRELLTAMLKDHVASPDTAAWLMAADVFEDDGMAAPARLWRRRGQWFPTFGRMFEGWLEAVYQPPWDTVRLFRHFTLAGDISAQVMAHRIWLFSIHGDVVLSGRDLGWRTGAPFTAATNVRATLRMMDHVLGKNLDGGTA